MSILPIHSIAMFKASDFHKIPRSVIIKLVISVLIWVASAIILARGKNGNTGFGGTRVIILITGVLIFTNVYNTIKKYIKDDSAIK